jgi:hypothetical protein
MTQALADRLLVLLAGDLLLGRGLGGGCCLAALGGEDEGDEVLDECGPRKSRKLQRGRRFQDSASKAFKGPLLEVLLVAEWIGSRQLVLGFGPSLGVAARCPAVQIVLVCSQP